LRALVVTAVALTLAGCGADRESAGGPASTMEAARTGRTEPRSSTETTTTTTTATTDTKPARTNTAHGSPNASTSHGSAKSASGQAPNSKSKYRSRAGPSTGSAPNKP
jgi:hypothetical protein